MIPAVRALRLVRAQLAILFVLGVFVGLEAFGIVPSTVELSRWITHVFVRYGLPAVAAISFIENLAGVNAYFPGSVAVLGSMALAAGDPQRGILTFLCIFVPAFVAHQINFAIGSMSVRASEAANSAASPNVWAKVLLFGTTLWHPHFAAITSIAAGAERMKYLKFLGLFLPVFFAWNAFWGFTMYFLGSTFKESSFSWLPIITVYVLVWLLWDLRKISRSG